MQPWSKWTSQPGFGLLLGAAGALIITPDTLFMRLSGMDGWPMLVWRGLLSGLVLAGLWCILAGRGRFDWRADLKVLCQAYGLGACVAGALGGAFFTLAVGETSVALVLVCLAVSPVFAALISRLLLGERTRPASWVVMLVCFGGVALAVLDADQVVMVTGQGTGSVIAGAGFALAAALMIGSNFVCLRADPRINILLVTGSSALVSGLIGLAFVDFGTLFQGSPAMISISGLIILPLSFFCLTTATRYTQAANISLLMILETVLGPVWVWLIVGERPGGQMILGGTLVITALVFYIRFVIRDEEASAGQP